MTGTPKIRPFLREVDEALRNPGGWVYRIKGELGPDGTAPPEAVVGAWKVDANGVIEGKFVPNPNYDPMPWLKR
jgi:hypothetical protein